MPKKTLTQKSSPWHLKLVQVAVMVCILSSVGLTALRVVAPNESGSKVLGIWDIFTGVSGFGQRLCTQQYQPVCGTNGQTYSNSCYASSAGAQIACQNACPCVGYVTPSPSPSFTPSPSPTATPKLGVSGINFNSSTISFHADQVVVSSQLFGSTPISFSSDDVYIVPGFDPKKTRILSLHKIVNGITVDLALLRFYGDAYKSGYQLSTPKILALGTRQNPTHYLTMVFNTFADRSILSRFFQPGVNYSFGEWTQKIDAGTSWISCTKAYVAGECSEFGPVNGVILDAKNVSFTLH